MKRRAWGSFMVLVAGLLLLAGCPSAVPPGESPPDQEPLDTPPERATVVSSWDGVFQGDACGTILDWQLMSDNTISGTWFSTADSVSIEIAGTYTLTGTALRVDCVGTASTDTGGAIATSPYTLTGSGSIDAESGSGEYSIGFSTAGWGSYDGTWIVYASRPAPDATAPSIVDSYVPPLTVSQGQSYSSTYFPLISGSSYRYTGTGSFIGSITMVVSGEVDFSTPLYAPDLPVVGSMTVLPTESVTLSDVSYDLIPVQQVSGDLVPGSGGSLIVQYYQITQDSVLLRAVGMNESIIEVQNPVYLKKPLVVGDSWETHPWFDLAAAFEASGDTMGVTIDSSSMSVKCKIFVVGPGSRLVLGNEMETMRIDEVVEALLVMTMGNPDSPAGAMTVTESIGGINAISYAEDIGIVAQEQDLAVSMHMTGTSAGLPVSMTMEEIIDTTVSLDSSYSPRLQAQVVPASRAATIPVGFKEKCLELAKEAVQAQGRMLRR